VRIGWLLGWAVPVGWFRALAEAALPGAEHRFFAAAPAAIDGLRSAGRLDWIVGYSLGSLLLLREPEGLPGPVALLAPIFAFPREEGLGGRIARAQVRQLARWVSRDPGAALRDFHRRAGLDIPDGDAPPLADLVWGLDHLEAVRVDPPLPPGWAGYCGQADPLLDAARLRELSPKISVLEGAGHHPAALIAAFAADAGKGGRT
jgi:hypothetical protein